MKKRFLSMLILLAAVVSGAWAQDPAKYKITLAEGTEDAENWSVPAEAPAGSPVTATYSGTKKVKSVKAVKVATPKPDLLAGEFSVSASKKVNFSKGNLSYASSKWSFFDNQYDYNTDYSADAWDHFGWSTSATTYGMNTSTDNSDYSGNFVDWGNNSDLQTALGTGWFTLSSAEWTYLFNTRSASTVGGTDNGRYAKAKVNDVNGLILFPDTYTHPDGVTAPTNVNTTNASFDSNTYTVADWTKMETAGCVFLPAASSRNGSMVNNPGSYGYYWSATPETEVAALNAFVGPTFLTPASKNSRCNGFSVRLVKAVDPLAVPLTIEAITAGTINVSNPKAGMQYSKNGGAKTAVTTSIDVAAGDKVRFYGNGTSINCYNGTKITGSGDGFTCKVYGNIMSLVDEENFATATTLSANNTFKSLFSGFTTLTDASGLLLPATQLALATSCYYSMFEGCSALTAAPALPATQLVPSCYYWMFKDCASLTTAPELPATTLANSCYYGMFRGCASLTTAPGLPATQLANHCYREMFYDCTALTASPMLPAETLVNYCYYLMFNNCSKLATVTCLATSGINQSNSTYNWLKNAGTEAEDTKTFYAVSWAEWPEPHNNGIPDDWTRVDVNN